MLYFLYNNDTFKKAGALTDLIEKQKIGSIHDQESFMKHFAMGKTIYCFINPYSIQIDNEIILSWALSEGDAWDKYYDSCKDI